VATTFGSFAPDAPDGVLRFLVDPAPAGPDVVAVFDVTGECDSIAWVACKNREEFSAIIKLMLQIKGVKKTNTYVVLNMIKDPFAFLPDFKESEEDKER